MTDVQFATSLTLFREHLKKDLFTGELSGERGISYHKLLIPIQPGAARDKIEARIKVAAGMNFYKVQLLGIVFLGRGSDEKIAVYLVEETVNAHQVSEARQAMMDLDGRAWLNYSVRAVL